MQSVPSLEDEVIKEENDAKKDEVTSQLDKKTKDFMLKSNFQQQIQEKLNQLGYLERPNRRMHKDKTNESIINLRRSQEPKT